MKLWEKLTGFSLCALSILSGVGNSGCEGIFVAATPTPTPVPTPMVQVKSRTTDSNGTGRNPEPPADDQKLQEFATRFSKMKTRGQLDSVNQVIAWADSGEAKSQTAAFQIVTVLAEKKLLSGIYKELLEKAFAEMLNKLHPVEVLPRGVTALSKINSEGYLLGSKDPLVLDQLLEILKLHPESQAVIRTHGLLAKRNVELIKKTPSTSPELLLKYGFDALLGSLKAVPTSAFVARIIDAASIEWSDESAQASYLEFVKTHPTESLKALEKTLLDLTTTLQGYVESADAKDKKILRDAAQLFQKMAEVIQ